ncbi:circadian clock-controlled protein [Clostridium botulinum]|uniref:circadian clock-controlled protein n=1 Tax=Clostridium botulinum TaxID=1491 RepID=UPI0013FE6C21|nr:circadian clock-controlled protein [Clostridium botulinum]MBY6915440.1 circadian clock-controlled protein [Clostridium botulinum]NFQ37668.1 circadian clock-controlled protein [Clostridium botulinum]
MARITVSFKETEKDIELHEYWNSMEDKSVEIKKVLRKEMERRKSLENKENEQKLTNKKEEKVNNILDF